METTLPFTPFHMGVALLAKPAARRHFSVLAFGLAQVAMDLEPLVGMLADREVLHGASHTVLGAVAIGAVVALLAPSILRPLVRFLHRKAAENGVAWLLDPQAPTRAAVWAGALAGTLSHVVLDALIHHDLHPLAPFSAWQPLLGLVAHDDVYLGCAVAGLVGAALWVASRWRQRRG